MRITGSIVTYHTDFGDLKKAIDSFLSTKLNIKLYIVDNSSDESIREVCKDERIEYIYNGANIGFGAAHNIAIKKAELINSKYHVIINPDIYYDKNTLEKIVNFMNKHISIGLLLPKILFPNNEIQYVCKLLPTPLNILIRSVLPKWKWAENINNKYEMKFKNYNEIMEVPYISGCFMVFRTKVFKEIGYFDEKFFMHFEDADISRRVFKKFSVVMFPNAVVYHKWEKGTYKNKKIRNITIKSAIYYFNKYGWFFDKERKKINKKCMNQ